MIARTTGLFAALVLSLAVVGVGEAQPIQPFRFIVSFQTDLNNYMQEDEFLNPTGTMKDLNCPPVFGGNSSPLCDPAFTGWYRDVYTVGVIDGVEEALKFFQGTIMRCGSLISDISDGATTKILAVDPKLRGSRGAAIDVLLTAIEKGCTIEPLNP
jgi:hypothetical protein